MHFAAQGGHVKITEMLIDQYGVDPTSRTEVTVNAYVTGFEKRRLPRTPPQDRLFTIK